MARPSSRSVSFAQAAQEKTKERESSRSGLQDEGSERNSTFESFDNFSTHNDLKEQYRLQNKTLSQYNDILESKLKDMEKKISDLISDNIELKNKNDMIVFKRQVNENLEVLERKLDGKIDEINRIVKDFKQSIQTRSDVGTQGEAYPNENFKSSSRRGTYHFNTKPITIFQDEPVRHSKTNLIRNDKEVPIEQNKENIPPNDKSKSPNLEKSKSASLSNSEPIYLNSTKDNTPTPIPQKTERNKATTKRRRRTTFFASQLDINDQMPKRSSRTRTPVDYKEPSLGKKLRRESVHMVDAVTDDYFKHLKKQRLQREPLQHVDNNRGKPTTKSTTAKEDNSIFDFVDKVKTNNRRYTIHH